ncbi:ABC transporter [Herbiconiux sp. CPCC 205716]|uniref:ABC transporter n=1 Tax=Herbiconiux gentiana TaxID=2970912 RepID=A0ABT2GJG3_9MICO|nr:ABC transporter [Herbiconiux gentiana]MCS5715742.1 ABC transporter [Herbiconiux gentiana]
MNPSSIPVRPAAAAVLLALVLGGCASLPDAAPGVGSAAAAPSPEPSGDGHGFVAGAVEMPEPQLRLVTLGSTGLQAFDPATGESLTIPGAMGDAVRTDDTAPDDDGTLTSDGRHAFVTRADGDVSVVDTGTWTVPHGDHSHYYLAEPRPVGRLDVGGDRGRPRAASSPALTTLSFPGASEGAAGLGVALDTEALAAGRLEERARIPLVPAGALLPLDGRLIGTVTPSDDAQSALVVYDAEGDPLSTGVDCAGAAGAALTRVGAVFGCADGAVLATTEAATEGATEAATEDGDAAGIAFERIPYPEGASATDRATSFAARPGRPDLAAVAGDRGAWLLDTRARSWTLLTSPAPLLRATAVGDADGTVVGVDVEGRIVVLAADGSVVRSEPVLAGELVGGELPPAIVLEVDADRAYVNTPSTGAVLEIDYRDGARIARTLAMPGGSAALAEVGR